jgi:anti-sigma factor RsiW
MNCTQARQHWHLFHDSEGDAEMHLQVNEHLEQCADCARWFSQQSALEESLVHSLKGGAEPTPALWEKIEQQLTPAVPVRSRRWLLFGSTVLTLAASLLIAVAMGVGNPPQSDLASLSVALHDKLASGRENPKFASTSHLEIEDYLKQHVSFPVRCPPRDDAGFEARGGGTCKLASDPVAYVVGRVDGEEVSLFILSRESLAHFPEQLKALERAGTHHQRQGSLDILMTQFDQNLVLVVGKARPEKLHRLLTAYGSYPHRG